jgi:hypothetical protein
MLLTIKFIRGAQILRRWKFNHCAYILQILGRRRNLLSNSLKRFACISYIFILCNFKEDLEDSSYADAYGSITDIDEEQTVAQSSDSDKGNVNEGNVNEEESITPATTP